MNLRYCSVESFFYDITEGKWRVEVKNILSVEMEVYIAEFLVVASGENSQGFIPTLPGFDTFLGKIVHANEYKSGSSYQDKEVLVVDCGNSGMEINYDLSNFGAHTVIVIRSPVFPGIATIDGSDVEFENGTQKRITNSLSRVTGCQGTIILTTGRDNAVSTVPDCRTGDYSEFLTTQEQLQMTFPRSFRTERKRLCRCFITSECSSMLRTCLKTPAYIVVINNLMSSSGYCHPYVSYLYGLCFMSLCMRYLWLPS